MTDYSDLNKKMLLFLSHEFGYDVEDLAAYFDEYLIDEFREIAANLINEKIDIKRKVESSIKDFLKEDKVYQEIMNQFNSDARNQLHKLINEYSTQDELIKNAHSSLKLSIASEIDKLEELRQSPSEFENFLSNHYAALTIQMREMRRELFKLQSEINEIKKGKNND